LGHVGFQKETLPNLVDYCYIKPGPSGVFPALKTGSQVSKLAEQMETGHGKAQLTHPEWSALLLDNLSEAAGGRVS
jgi:hypothetical protein